MLHRENRSEPSQQRKQKSGEKRIDIIALQQTFQKHQNHSQNSRYHSILPIAAEKHRKRRRHHGVENQPHTCGIAGRVLNRLQLVRRLGERRYRAADITGKLIQTIQTIHIRILPRDSSGLRQRTEIRPVHRHHDTGSNRKHVHAHSPVSRADSANTVFHAMYFSAAHQHLFPDIECQIQISAGIISRIQPGCVSVH